MASLCREAALGPIRAIIDIQNVNAADVSAFPSFSVLFFLPPFLYHAVEMMENYIIFLYIV